MSTYNHEICALDETNQREPPSNNNSIWLIKYRYNQSNVF